MCVTYGVILLMLQIPMLGLEEAFPLGDMMQDQMAPPPVAHPPSQPALTSDAEPPATWTTGIVEPVHENLFRGNWFKKRGLVQGARVEYEELHKLVQHEWKQAHDQFLTNYAPLLDQMRQKLATVGFGDQDVVAVEKMLQEQVLTGSSVSNEYFRKLDHAVIEKLTPMLAELHIQFKRLNDIIIKFDESLQTIKHQEQLGAEYEQKAWKAYEEIDQAYNDQLAALLYERVKASRQYLAELLTTFLQKSMVSYCTMLSQEFQGSLQKIEQIYKDLHGEGLFLRKGDMPPEPVAAPVKKVELSWWQRFLQWLGALWASFTRLFGK